ASSNFRWATVVSQAPGLRGGPSLSQFAAAEAKASCKDSSARSKDPEMRIRVAMIRPYSSLKTFSSISLACDIRRALHIPKAACNLSKSKFDVHEQSIAHWPDRPNLNAAFAALACGRDLTGPFNCLIDGFAIKNVVTSQLLLCLCEGSVRSHH